MTNAAAPPVPTSGDSSRAIVRWVRAKDPDLLVLKRSVRAAIVMPSVFAVAHVVSSNSQVALFGAFGSFALLLFVEFGGKPSTRLASYMVLYVVGAGLIALGTVASTNEAAAVLAMAAVGFCVLFAGVVTPLAASASTALLLTFVLPVAVAVPASQVGARLIGWTLAGLFSITACVVLWPPPWHDNLRRRLAATVSSVARLAHARAQGVSDADAQAEVASELIRLRQQFAGTPYPPIGAASSAVALSKLVGRVEWVAGTTAIIDGARWSNESVPARHVTEQIATVLDRTASVICDGDAHPVDDPARILDLQAATVQLDRLIKTEVEEDESYVLQSAVENDPANAVPPSAGDEGIAATLDPGFHARAVGIATQMVADAALEAAGSDAVIDPGLGLENASVPHLYLHRILSHLSFRSVWFRNALRGAMGLAIAVAIVEVTDVQHGFWVVLGTLSVLRSNAVGTGATALRAVGGTTIGVVIGSLIMVGLADHSVLLWILLPLAVLIAGIAPSMISFAAGQAAFTLTIIILFNIIEPVGWKVGLTRIEDVAIGCGVSVVVGLLFWPRGATAALGRALSGAFVASSAYLADSVDRLTMTSRRVDTGPGQQASQRAYFLLDDAFRQFLTERGAKVVSVDTIARLFTGSNRLRLAAYTLGTLPVHPPDPAQEEVESVAVAEAVLRDSYASSHRWYQEFAEFLAEQRPSIGEPSSHNSVLHHALQSAFDDVRSQHRVDRIQTTLQMLWADELLENQNTMQADLLASADLFVRRKRREMLL
jgi:uncharacterized membrane protein YccC